VYLSAIDGLPDVDGTADLLAVAFFESGRGWACHPWSAIATLENVHRRRLAFDATLRVHLVGLR